MRHRDLAPVRRLRKVVLEMDVVVRGKNRTVPTRLESVTREKAAKIARFTHDAGRVEVDFSEVHTARLDGRQLCEITVHLKRRFLKAHASAAEPEAALDGAIDKVGHQVARLKDKRVTRSHPRRSRTTTGNGAAPLAVDADDDARDLDGDGDPVPRIVKTKRFDAKPMDPEEAALQMELLGHAFFLFTNTETGHAALLYRRNDGNLGLIETTV
jgi:putative sigma-54 modulation protein